MCFVKTGNTDLFFVNYKIAYRCNIVRADANCWQPDRRWICHESTEKARRPDAPRDPNRQKAPVQTATPQHLPRRYFPLGQVVPRLIRSHHRPKICWILFTRCWPRTVTASLWKPRSDRTPMRCCATCFTRPRASGCTRPTRARAGASTNGIEEVFKRLKHHMKLESVSGLS